MATTKVVFVIVSQDRRSTEGSKLPASTLLIDISDGATAGLPEDRPLGRGTLKFTQKDGVKAATYMTRRGDVAGYYCPLERPGKYVFRPNGFDQPPLPPRAPSASELAQQQYRESMVAKGRRYYDEQIQQRGKCAQLVGFVQDYCIGVCPEEEVSLWLTDGETRVERRGRENITLISGGTWAIGPDHSGRLGKLVLWHDAGNAFPRPPADFYFHLGVRLSERGQ